MKNNPMLPTVTIGIPTYNRSGMLWQAIQSILQQSYQDFEIVVSDDCSPDDTAQVVASFNDKRIKYHRTTTNLRPPRNWNECVRLAQGEFFALLPDDDVYCPDFLAEMVKKLQSQPNIGFVQCAFYGIDEQLRPYRTVQMSSSELILHGEAALIWQIKNLSCIPASVLFRRSIMLTMGLWREDYWDDWAFIIRVAYRYGFIFLPKILTCNRVHGQNLNLRLFGEGRDAILDLINQQANIFGEALPATPALEKLKAELSRELSHHCVLLALSALRHGQWSQAKFHFSRARHLYALAGFDPSFIKLRWQLYQETKHHSQQQQLIQAQTEPILKLGKSS